MATIASRQESPVALDPRTTRRRVNDPQKNRGLRAEKEFLSMKRVDLIRSEALWALYCWSSDFQSFCASRSRVFTSHFARA